MIKIKSYSNIWSVEKVLYAVGDVNLPIPFTFGQIGWFVAGFIVMMAIGGLPPFSLLDNWLIKNIGIPVLVTWFMNQKAFDGKSPLKFLKSIVMYTLRAKMTYAGQPVKAENKCRVNENITMVRSETYDIPD